MRRSTAALLIELPSSMTLVQECIVGINRSCHVVDGGVDVWALGCTLYAMAFGTCPFESPVEGIMKLAILDGKVSFPANNMYHCCSFSAPFCKFIRFMLRVNIEERITIEDCIEKAELLLQRCPKPPTF